MELTIDVEIKDGHIDHDATIVSFKRLLAKTSLEYDTEQLVLKTTINQVFVQNEGQRLTTDYVISCALLRLNATSENYSQLSKKLKSFIKNNTGENKLFTVISGSNGGIIRNKQV